MTVRLSDEQREFQDTLRSFFAEQLSSEYLRKRIEAPDSSDPKLWRKISELGIISSFASSEDGGVDLGIRELAILAFECGRALCPEALLESILCGPVLFSKLAKNSRTALDNLLGKELLSKILNGNERSTCALQAEPQGGKFFIAIDKAKVLVLPLKTGVKVVNWKGEGSAERLLDGTIKTFSADLDNCPAVEISITPKFELLYSLLKAAELAGVSSRAVEMTTEYVKTRKQFDVPVGGFQAVQHRLSDMYLKTEAMRSLATFGAWAADHSLEQVSLAGRTAITFATEHGSSIVEGAIQLHGGIGFTWEYDLHLFLRRAKTVEALFKPSQTGLDEIISAAQAS